MPTTKIVVTLALDCAEYPGSVFPGEALLKSNLEHLLLGFFIVGKSGKRIARTSVRKARVTEITKQSIK